MSGRMPRTEIGWKMLCELEKLVQKHRLEEAKIQAEMEYEEERRKNSEIVIGETD